MYKSISAAYSVIVLSYWQLAFVGYWAFGSEVQPYILASLSIPEWTVVMANLFAAIQISGCFQVLSLFNQILCSLLLIPIKIMESHSSPVRYIAGQHMLTSRKEWGATNL